MKGLIKRCAEIWNGPRDPGREDRQGRPDHQGSDAGGNLPAATTRVTAQRVIEGLIRYGSGPLVLSTATTVDRPLVWDVNGYYRALGLVAPYRHTKVEIRRAYAQVSGQQSPFLTIAAKTLLNKHSRLEYDRMPRGRAYIDEWTRAELELKARLKARREGLDEELLLNKLGLVTLTDDEQKLIARMKRRDELEGGGCSSQRSSDRFTVKELGWSFLYSPGAQYESWMPEKVLEIARSMYPSRNVAIGITTNGPDIITYETQPSTTRLINNILPDTECLLVLIREKCINDFIDKYSGESQ